MWEDEEPHRINSEKGNMRDETMTRLEDLSKHHPINKTMWWTAKKCILTDVVQIPGSYTPTSVPEYMWERSADVNPFSVMTVKSSEKAAASGFRCRRKVLTGRNTSERMNKCIYMHKKTNWSQSHAWGGLGKWICWGYLWKAVKSSCRLSSWDQASLLALSCFLWTASLSYDNLS